MNAFFAIFALFALLSVVISQKEKEFRQFIDDFVYAIGPGDDFLLELAAVNAIDEVIYFQSPDADDVGQV